MNKYSPIVKAILNGFPYVIEDEGQRAVLTGIHALKDGDVQGIYNTGSKEKAYLLPELRCREDAHLLRTIIRHPYRSCVRARFDKQRNAWLLEVNHPTVNANGWEEERCFYCGHWVRHPEEIQDTFISGHALECLADYAMRGFQFVDR